MQAMLSPNPHYHLLNYVTSGELLSAAKPWFYCLLNEDKDSTHSETIKESVGAGPGWERTLIHKGHWFWPYGLPVWVQV